MASTAQNVDMSEEMENQSGSARCNDHKEQLVGDVDRSEQTQRDTCEEMEVTNDTSSTHDNMVDTERRVEDVNRNSIVDEKLHSEAESSGAEKVLIENFVRDSSDVLTLSDTKKTDSVGPCESETTECSVELKSENVETDSLNSVGDLSVDDHIMPSLDENHAVVQTKLDNMVKEEEIKKEEDVVSGIKPEVQAVDMHVMTEKQRSDSDLSKTDSQSNTSIDQAAADNVSSESTKQKRDSKSSFKTKSDSKQKEASKKSDSLASKLKSRITRTADSIKKSDKPKKTDMSDKTKSDKKAEKKDKRSEKSLKSKLSNLRNDASKSKSSVSKTSHDLSKPETKDTVTDVAQLHSEQLQSVESESVSEDPKADGSASDMQDCTSQSGSAEVTPATVESGSGERQTGEGQGDVSESSEKHEEHDQGSSVPSDSTIVQGDMSNQEEPSLDYSGDGDMPLNNLKETDQEHATETPEHAPKVAEQAKEGRAKVVVHRAGSHDQGDVDFSMADFGSLSKQAEQRLAARRAAREEARLIRMKELERQQREMEEKQDRIYELTRDSGARGFSTSRRGSDDSTSSEDTRELKKQLAELEDKYKKAMMNNAQLDNEKQKYRYEVDILKDKYEEIEENHIEIQREHKDRCKELEQKKRDLNDLQIEAEYLKLQITQRDKLIQEYGLVFVSNETVEDENDKKKKRRRRKKEEQEKDTAALVTPDALTVLGKVQGNLDERLKHFADNQLKMEEEIKKLRIELDEERAKNVLSEKYNSPKSHKDSSMNGPSSDGMAHEANMEAQKQLTEYRYKLKKAEQDITVLEGNVKRLESQVKRYKSAADEGEKTVEDMKLEKRKLQRDLRDAQYKVEELNSQNQNLQTRIKTLKQERIDSIISGKS